MSKDYITIEQAARRLQIGERSVYRYIESKEIKAVKIGFWRIDKKSIQDFIKRRSNEFSRRGKKQ